MLTMDKKVLKMPLFRTPGHSNTAVDTMYNKNMLLMEEATHANVTSKLIESM